MSQSPDMSSFGKFIPGFEFLQTMAKQNANGASPSASSIPNLGSWMAPTLNEEEISKRIDELKAVSYWLDQNAAALKATIQALEVQKMTLATLKGMNFSFATAAATAEGETPKAEAVAEAGKVDAMQWWQALTEQFGQIASKTMQDVAEKAAAVHPPIKTPAKSRAKSTTAKSAAKSSAKAPKSKP